MNKKTRHDDDATADADETIEQTGSQSHEGHATGGQWPIALETQQRGIGISGDMAAQYTDNGRAVPVLDDEGGVPVSMGAAC